MGLQDCPDWLLAEIVVLAKLTSVKQKMLVAGVIKDMCGIPLDYAKVAKWTSDAKLVKPIAQDSQTHTVTPSSDANVRRDACTGRADARPDGHRKACLPRASFVSLATRCSYGFLPFDSEVCSRLVC